MAGSLGSFVSLLLLCFLIVAPRIRKRTSKWSWFRHILIPLGHLFSDIDWWMLLLPRNSRAAFMLLASSPRRRVNGKVWCKRASPCQHHPPVKEATEAYLPSMDNIYKASSMTFYSTGYLDCNFDLLLFCQTTSQSSYSRIMSDAGNCTQQIDLQFQNNLNLYSIVVEVGHIFAMPVRVHFPPLDTSRHSVGSPCM